MVWRLRTPAARASVVTMLALLLVQYVALMSAHRAAAAQVETERFYVGVGDRRDGFAPGFTRNQIERRAIETWRTGGYDRTILVDQHGYFDLRMVRLAGMRPVYVNMFNDEEVLRGLDRASDHLLLLSPGSYAADPNWWRPWMSPRTHGPPWTPEAALRYNTYRGAARRLSRARGDRGAAAAPTVGRPGGTRRPYGAGRHPAPIILRITASSTADSAMPLVVTPISKRVSRLLPTERLHLLSPMAPIFSSFALVRLIPKPRRCGAFEK
jgi:hypothetical protein